MRHLPAVLCAAIIVLCVGAIGFSLHARGVRRRAVEAGMQARQEPVLTAAPVPAPRGLPVSIPAAQAEGGLPGGYVDGVALRALLLRRQFEDLTLAVEQLQWGFESNPRDEHWMTDGMLALGNADPDSEALLDAWVAASPDSFAPYLARGTHWVNVGYLRRGGKFLEGTAPEELRGMEAAFERAVPDLARAWGLKPKAVAAARPLLQVAHAVGNRKMREDVFQRALEQCPSCSDFRVSYLHGLRPRWGGSYEAMDAFAEAQARAYPELAFLRGFADWDRSTTPRKAGNDRAALALVDRALAAGEHWQFRLDRAERLRRLEALEPALTEVNRALELRPSRSEGYFERARLLALLRKWEPAGRDLLHGVRLEATHAEARALRPYVVKGLLYTASEHRKAGRHEDALRILELAGELSPGDPEVARWRARVVTSQAPAAAPLPAAGTPAPDDFRAVQQQDYALARERRFAEILPLWNAFLERNPEHGLAYLERSGTHYHLRDLAAAMADLKRACDLGVNEGCARVRQLERARAAAH